ncbi:hypothetical protein PV326_011229, partial [Microctonus aethiopoides]
PTCIAEDSLKTCYLECMQELNIFEKEKIMDEEKKNKARRPTNRIDDACLRRIKVENDKILFDIQLFNLAHQTYRPTKMWTENIILFRMCNVWASGQAGFGHAQMEQMLAAMSISCMSSKTYMKLCESNISDRWLQCTNSVMKAAGEEERRIAVETGSVNDQRNPLISVIVDGPWAKRSYSSGGNSDVGTAIMIGYKTGKVSFYEYRNRYCVICNRANNMGKV